MLILANQEYLHSYYLWSCARYHDLSKYLDHIKRWVIKL